MSRGPAVTRWFERGSLPGRASAAALLVVLAGAALPGPAAAQTAVGCAPYCDYRHYYGTYTYDYVQRGVYCAPICDAFGNCVPAKTCVRAPNAIPSTSTVTYYDPTIATPGVVGPRRTVRSTAVRSATVRVRPYRPQR